ncbi:MAG TPA: hypothetical protein VNH18_09190 [Bryobacteraceae bacterium]|nr:hypothetical protein [Bryobacteraceae bacterium]
MPVEVGDVFFFAMAFDQAKDSEDRMNQMAREKQAELLASLSRR